MPRQCLDTSTVTGPARPVTIISATGLQTLGARKMKGLLHLIAYVPGHALNLGDWRDSADIGAQVPVGEPIVCHTYFIHCTDRAWLPRHIQKASVAQCFRDYPHEELCHKESCDTFGRGVQEASVCNARKSFVFKQMCLERRVGETEGRGALTSVGDAAGPVLCHSCVRRSRALHYRAVCTSHGDCARELATRDTPQPTGAWHARAGARGREEGMPQCQTGPSAGVPIADVAYPRVFRYGICDWCRQ
ncbi:hypothetical protein NDU88_001799 [Pleurodeles waltl]|uniref:Uncharacterized protein n=1 Tax=Pleurodeles waltl TaxID=8319 RepID=A0AAV7M248_PLEWA|nr:hypothetical protein NDU88_001799 [Pleurodeles waltl]